MRPVSWCALGYYLEERPSFTLDPSYHAGVYYAQEAASMVLYTLIKHLNLPEGTRVLDLCAAPGGKTSAMLDALPPNSVVLANEINRHRSNILAENLGKWGVENILVSNDSPEAFSGLKDCFDVVWPSATVYLDSSNQGERTLTRPYARVDRPKLKRKLLEQCKGTGTNSL